jgi:hypothetical protein
MYGWGHLKPEGFGYLHTLTNTVSGLPSFRSLYRLTRIFPRLSCISAPRCTSFRHRARTRNLFSVRVRTRTSTLSACTWYMLETGKLLALPSRNAFHIGCPLLAFENRGFPNWFCQLPRFTCLGPHGSFFVSGTIYEGVPLLQSLEPQSPTTMHRANCQEPW